MMMPIGVTSPEKIMERRIHGLIHLGPSAVIQARWT